MEGAGSGAANGVLMGFGDGSGAGGFSPLMIMPLMSAGGVPPPPSSEHGLFFLPPPPPPPGTHSNHNAVASCSSSSMTHSHHIGVHVSALPPAMDAKERSTSNDCNHDVKAKIMSHPHYPRLLSAYVNCHKLGAPPEVVARLEEVCGGAGGGGGGGGRLGEDPALDQFMEAYCEMLTKYEEELSKPFREAMLFLSRIESQFKSLSLSSPTSSLHAPPATGYGEPSEKNVSSEEDVDISETYNIDPQAEDRELKGQLLRKYSGYLGGLKQEFLKRRKKGKLPKEARHQLLDWWNRHYKWPYPSESQKLALAEATGLDQKQINNWFINQRKRHWKPSEDMQFVTVDPSRPHYYLDNALGNPFSVGCGPALL